MADIPRGYSRLEGSEHHYKNKRRVAPANHTELISASVYVRHRPDSPPLPDLEYWMKPQPGGRKFFSQEEFAVRYGADQSDLEKIVSFGRAHGLNVVEMSAARRLVRLSGTVAQMDEAFGVELGKYEHDGETYRDHEGHIHVPNELTNIVQGVFGLDNRTVSQPNGVPVTPPIVTKQYNFPPGVAAGQTIGILEFGGGFSTADITFYFTSLGLPAPTVTAVSVDSAANTLAGSLTNISSPSFDAEVMLDICVAAGAAPGAAIAVYFAPNTSQGYMDAITTATNDAVNRPSVISTSWSSDEQQRWSSLGRYNVTIALQAAAAMGVTVFVASGDTGSNLYQNDGKAHVTFPSSCPWVTACGGTAILAMGPLIEGTWNSATLATGGGISSTFGLPPYQMDAGIPPSINDGVSIGRGVPDIAGDVGGYDLVLYGKSTSVLKYTTGPLAGFSVGPLAGTSAVAPLYAGLVALINAQTASRLGFITSDLYLIGKTKWLHVFRDISDGANNSVSFATAGVSGTSPGYSSGPGWDACTGWGVPDGAKLQQALTVGHVINKNDSTPYAPAACEGIYGSGASVQLFWKANDHTNLIFASGSNGLTFPPGNPINGIDRTNRSPAACLFNGELFVFWKANKSSKEIYVSASSNNVIWPPGVPVNSFDRTPDSPAVCVFLQHIFLFWTSDDPSHSMLFSSSLNGLTFPKGRRINNIDRTPQSPAVCVFQDRIFVFWKADDSNSIYFTSSGPTSSVDDMNFPPGQPINNIDSTPVSPSACVVDDQIFLFWKSDDEFSYLYWTVSRDGINWSEGRKVNYPDATPDTPVPVTFNDILYLFWRANDDSKSIYGLSRPFSLFK